LDRSVGVPLGRRDHRRAPKVMAFEVGGVPERHQMVFSFNQFWGGPSIKVDGGNVISQVQLASVDLVNRFDLVVGVQEQHHVHIEKHRKLMFAGFRPQPVYTWGRPAGCSSWTGGTPRTRALGGPGLRAAEPKMATLRVVRSR